MCVAALSEVRDANATHKVCWLQAAFDGWLKAAFEGYLAEARGHGFMADAALDYKVKAKLEANHKAKLGKTLKSAMNIALKEMKDEAWRQQWRAAYKVKEFLNKRIRFWVDVSDKRKNDKLKVVVLHENTPLLVIKRLTSGPADFLGFMTLSNY